MKKYLQYLYMKTASLNLKNIFNLLEKNNNAKFLDLGCGDGNRTMKLSKAIGTINIYGVEIVDEKIKIAKEMLPELEMFQRVTGEKAKVRFFEGREGIKMIQKDLLHSSNNRRKYW